jgi:type IV pilus assembly protein PilA
MRKHGFTLIEVLVVIVILAVLMAIALPLYLKTVGDSQRQTCRSNMQTIANAEQAYKPGACLHRGSLGTGGTEG